MEAVRVLWSLLLPLTKAYRPYPGHPEPGVHQRVARAISCTKFFHAASAAAKALQSCLTLCDPIDGSPPGSIPGILQVRTLEWVAVSFSKAWK